MAITRHSRNVRAWRGSGGIGIFVKDEITQIFTVTIIDNTFDGILGIALTHKWSGVRLAVFVQYVIYPQVHQYGEVMLTPFLAILSHSYTYLQNLTT